MVYDDESGGNREGSDSAPKKRKRISTNERYEKVKIGVSSPDGQPARNPRITDDRQRDLGSYDTRERNPSTDRGDISRDRGFSGDRGGFSRERSLDSDRGGFSRERSNDGNRGGFSRERSSEGDRGGFSRERNYNSDRGGDFNRERSSTGDRGGFSRERNYNTDRERNYNTDRERNYNTDRERNYNSDRSGDFNRERNYNSDRSSTGGGSRYPQRDDSRGGFQKKSYGGSTSKSYGSDNRGGFQKKSYSKPGSTGGYQANRGGSKPYGKFSKPGYRDDNRPQRQPEYHFADEVDVNAPIRLNKYIANTGLCSRREADEHIKAGLIMVNDVVVTELGVKVLPTDSISYNGAKLSPEKKVYILLNKPKDYVTSVDDPHAKRTIMELVSGACKERIYPVGRLDRMTTGVILLTNDGELTKKLTHPASEIKKIYHVALDKNAEPEHVDAIAEGVTLEDGFIKVDNVGYLTEEDQRLLGIELHSGRNRIVRRIFENSGYKVTRLDRIFFGGLTKKGLSRGKWRYLAPKEVGYLKMLKV